VQRTTDDTKENTEEETVDTGTRVMALSISRGIENITVGAATDRSRASLIV
jgi:hypothetical protein